MGGGSGNKGVYKGDDAENMCSTTTLEPDPRYQDCCSSICRPGKVMRDIIIGFLVVLGIAVVIAVLFVVCFYLLPDTEESTLGLEESAFVGNPGNPKEDEHNFNVLPEVEFTDNIKYDTRPDVVLEEIRKEEMEDMDHHEEPHHISPTPEPEPEPESEPEPASEPEPEPEGTDHDHAHADGSMTHDHMHKDGEMTHDQMDHMDKEGEMAHDPLHVEGEITHDTMHKVEMTHDHMHTEGEMTHEEMHKEGMPHDHMHTEGEMTHEQMHKEGMPHDHMDMGSEMTHEHMHKEGIAHDHVHMEGEMTHDHMPKEEMSPDHTQMDGEVGHEHVHLEGPTFDPSAPVNEEVLEIVSSPALETTSELTTERTIVSVSSASGPDTKVEVFTSESEAGVASGSPTTFEGLQENGSLPPLLEAFTPHANVTDHSHQEDITVDAPIEEVSAPIFASEQPAIQTLPTGSCRPRQLEMCSDLPYSQTALPNWAKDQTDIELQEVTLPFFRDVIVRSGCSPRARQYACGIMEPACNNDGSIVPPCRAFCRSVASTCQEFIISGFSLSDVFNCEQFPDSSDPSVCFDATQAGGDDILVEGSRALPHHPFIAQEIPSSPQEISPEEVSLIPDYPDYPLVESAPVEPVPFDDVFATGTESFVTESQDYPTESADSVLDITAPQTVVSAVGIIVQNDSIPQNIEETVAVLPQEAEIPQNVDFTQEIGVQEESEIIAPILKEEVVPHEQIDVETNFPHEEVFPQALVESKDILQQEIAIETATELDEFLHDQTSFPESLFDSETNATPEVETLIPTETSLAFELEDTNANLDTLSLSALDVTCDQDSFLCQDGSGCVSLTTVCDGLHQCPDGSDEFNCTNVDVSPATPASETGTEFLAEEGTVTTSVPDITFDDATTDVVFEETTLFNEQIAAISQCPELQCLDGTCLALSQLNNGVNDCSDGTDEQDFAALLGA